MKLYSKDSKGNIRVLEVYSDLDTLFQISGLLNGKMVESSKVITEKNIGKSNYKTGEEVALERVESIITEKLRSGYFKTIEEARDEAFIEPSLAKVYGEEKNKIVFRINGEPNCFIQPKLDGQRCYTSLDGEGGVKMMSRGFKVLSTHTEDGVLIKTKFTHIEEELRKYRGFPVIIDGELYAHNLSFQDNMKLIKKDRGGDNPLKYHIYDTMNEKKFSDRINLFNSFGENIKKVETFIVDSFEKIEEYHSEFVSKGYEGSIIRWGNTGYEMKRTQHMLKKKDFDDIIAEVVNIEPQEANPEHGTLIVVSLEGDSYGKEFKCGYKASHEDREELLRNKSEYIGKTAEIRFFGLSDNNIPRFPVCVGFRNDK